MGSQSEVWYWIDNATGRLMQHTELDGYAFMRHGACARDVPVNLDELDLHQARDVAKRLLRVAHRLQKERKAAQCPPH